MEAPSCNPQVTSILDLRISQLLNLRTVGKILSTPCRSSCSQGSGDSFEMGYSPPRHPSTLKGLKRFTMWFHKGFLLILGLLCRVGGGAGLKPIFFNFIHSHCRGSRVGNGTVLIRFQQSEQQVSEQRSSLTNRLNKIWSMLCLADMNYLNFFLRLQNDLAVVIWYDLIFCPFCHQPKWLSQIFFVRMKHKLVVVGLVTVPFSRGKISA